MRLHALSGRAGAAVYAAEYADAASESRRSCVSARPATPAKTPAKKATALRPGPAGDAVGRSPAPARKPAQLAAFVPWDGHRGLERWRSAGLAHGTPRSVLAWKRSARPAAPPGARAGPGSAASRERGQESTLVFSRRLVRYISRPVSRPQMSSSRRRAAGHSASARRVNNKFVARREKESLRALLGGGARTAVDAAGPVARVALARSAGSLALTRRRLFAPLIASSRSAAAEASARRPRLPRRDPATGTPLFHVRSVSRAVFVVPALRRWRRARRASSTRRTR